MRSAGGLSPALSRPQGLGTTFFAKLVLVKTGNGQNIFSKILTHRRDAKKNLNLSCSQPPSFFLLCVLCVSAVNS